MAGIKISGLPVAGSSLTTDFFAAVQGGITQRETLLQVRTLFGFNTTTGLLALANGGTNANLTATANALVYSNTTAFTLLSPTNSAVLATSAAGLPTWLGSLTNGQIVIGSTGAIPAAATVTAGTSIGITNGAASITVAVLPSAANSILASSNTSVATWVGPLTNGQMLIGSTGATPVAATITGSSGISVTAGAGTLNISGGGSGYGWTEVVGVSQSMAVDNGYIANNVALVTLTLPVTASVGDSVILQGKGTGLYSIAQNAGQTIHFGSVDSTTGVGGSVTATNRYDSVELLCITANTDWAVLTGAQGTFTIV